jgi:hypothetical protein
MNKKNFFILLSILFSTNIIHANEFFPVIKNWEKPTDIQKYDAGNLWDYINGAADLYHKYHFKSLQVGDYKMGTEYITVEIYDMKTQNNAFGIYSAERATNVEFLKIGAEAYLGKGILNMLYGPYYIKIFSNYTEAPFTELAAAITEAFFACTAMPYELDAFPQKNKVNHSEKFIASAFLGLSYFNNIFTSQYIIDGKELTLFLINADSENEIKTVIEQYNNFVNKSNTALPEDRKVFNDKYNGEVIIEWKKNILFGITGNADTETKSILLDEFKQQLKKGYLL